MINFRRTFIVTTMLVLYLTGLCSQSKLAAQQLFHASSMINYELMNQHWPGYDITLLFGSSWGFRYSQMTDLNFLETLEDNNQSVKKNRYQGDLEIPMLLKTIDFKSFQDGPAKVFDFITAYAGAGYNKLELTLTQLNYQAEAGSLVKTTREETVEAEITAFALGIYGGENIVVIDFRLQYIKGTIEKSDFVDKENRFEKWMMIVSFGVGY